VRGVRAFPLLLGLAVVGLLAAMSVVGSFVPVDQREDRAIDVERGPQEVWRLLSRFEEYPGWLPGVETSRLISETPEAQLWEQAGPGGTMTIEVSSIVPGRGFRSRVVGEGVPFSSSWSYELLPLESGTRIVLTQESSIPGRIDRFFARFVFGRTHAAETFLEAVAEELGSTAVPGPAPVAGSGDSGGGS
jgi:uncharacterized protein YndB with AHSA1/START domain